MGLLISEANAVNTVIKHLTGARTHTGGAFSRWEAIDALVLLARGAHKVLSAGFTPDHTGRFSAREALTTRWSETPGRVWMLEMHGGGAEPYATEQAARHKVVTEGGWDAGADLAWRTDGTLVRSSIGDTEIKTLYVDGLRTLCYLWPATVHGSTLTPEQAAAALAAAPDVDVAACTVCGCTEDEPCEGGCAWVTEGSLAVDLCTACAWAIARDVVKSGLYQGRMRMTAQQAAAFERGGVDLDAVFEANGGLYPMPELSQAEIDAMQPLIAEVEAAQGDLAKLDEIQERERATAAASTGVLDEPAVRVAAFLAERSTRAGRPYNNPLITTWHGRQLLEPDLRGLLAERAEQRARVARMAETLRDVNEHRNQLVRDLTACAQATPGEYWRAVAARHAPGGLTAVDPGQVERVSPRAILGIDPDFAADESKDDAIVRQQAASRVHAFLAAWGDAESTIDGRPVGAISTLRTEGLRLTAADLRALLADVARLSSEVEQLQVELGYALAPDDEHEPLTLLDVDPDAVYATQDDDYDEERGENS